MKIELGEQDQTEIGFAPLIDCIFLLLIFFLVATSFKQQEEAKKEQEILVDLPSATASFDWKNASSSPLVIGVDKEGKFYWGEDVVTAVELRSHLQREKAQNPKRRIRIDGDRATQYQNIVHVLELCQFEGFQNIGIHTRK